MNIRKWVLPVVVGVAFGTLACSDDPFAIRWEANPDTVRLFSVSSPVPNVVSGFDFSTRSAVRIESPLTEGRWDLAVDIRDGEFVWVPPGAIGLSDEAGIGVLEGQTFLTATRAPGDTAAYASRAPLPIQKGLTYVVRTRRSRGAFGSLCTYYGKVEALELDGASGSVTFQFDVSPVCNGRDLVPPD